MPAGEMHGFGQAGKKRTDLRDGLGVATQQGDQLAGAFDPIATRTWPDTSLAKPGE